MKKLLTFLPFLAIIACSKPNNNGGNTTGGNNSGGNNNPNPSNPTTTITYISVPNWANDTLIGVWQRVSNNTVGKDTIYSSSVNGKSYITYLGVRYEIKAYSDQQGNQGSSISTTSSSYLIDIFNSAGQTINPHVCAVSPHKYFDSSTSSWDYQDQDIIVTDPPFSDSVILGYYSTMYK